jgi:carbonic anhydrase
MLKRRDLLKAGLLASVGLPGLAIAGNLDAQLPGLSRPGVARRASSAQGGASGLATTPAAALAELLAGNQRYLEGSSNELRRMADRRAAVAAHQEPFATIVSCSDSRVPPEIVFDHGLGDLFVVRTAGHVVDAAALGSIEYAVDHLHTPMILVLGHKECGAVTAAVQAVQGRDVPAYLYRLIAEIGPAAQAGLALDGDPVENAVRANVQHTVAELAASRPILADQTERGTLGIVGAYYDLDTGAVSLV